MAKVLDDFFADGKMGQLRAERRTFVHYRVSGRIAQTGEKIIMGIYFKAEGAIKPFSIDRMTMERRDHESVEQLGVISKINDSYRESHGLASSNALDETGKCFG